MIEKQVQDIYNKYKGQLLENITADVFYDDFVNMIRGGTRTYTSHNVYVERNIDEEWVNRIDMTIPYLSKIINNPRQFLKSFEEVVPVELAKKTNANTIKHLSSHTSFIRSIDDGMVTPSKVLSTYNDDTLDIYENRFISTLLKRTCDFVEIRYIKLLANMGGEKAAEFTLSGNFGQSGETTTYDMKIKIEQDAKYMADHNLYRLLFERIQKVRNYLNAFNETPFIKVLKNLPQVRSPINKTNLLTKSPDYMACFELWEYLEQYTKPGYKINVIDTNPVPDEETISEAELVMMFYYLLLKNNMPGSRDAKETEFRSQAYVEPQVIRKYNTAYEEKVEIGESTGENDGGSMAEISFGLSKDSNITHSIKFDTEKKESLSFTVPPGEDKKQEAAEKKASGASIDDKRKIIPRNFSGLDKQKKRLESLKLKKLKKIIKEDKKVSPAEEKLLVRKQKELNKRLETPVSLEIKKPASHKKPVTAAAKPAMVKTAGNSSGPGGRIIAPAAGRAPARGAALVSRGGMHPVKRRVLPSGMAAAGRPVKTIRRVVSSPVRSSAPLARPAVPVRRTVRVVR